MMKKMCRNLTIGEVKEFLKEAKDKNFIYSRKNNHDIRLVLADDKNRKILTVGEFKRKILDNYSESEQGDDLIVIGDNNQSFTINQIIINKNIFFDSNGRKELGDVCLISF